MSAVAGLVRSELTKLVTLRSTWVLVGTLVVLDAVVVGTQLPLYVDAVAAAADGVVEVVPGDPQTMTALAAELATWPLQVGLLVLVLGAHAGGSDVVDGRLGASVLAVPDRVRLVVAKAVATAVLGLAVGLAMLATSVPAAARVLAGHDLALLWAPGAVSGYAGFLLVTVALTLVGLALGTVGRGTLAGVLGGALLLGVTLSQVLGTVAPQLDALVPTSAARNLLVAPTVEPPLTSSPAAAAAVLVAWAVAGVAAAAWTVRVRDAR